MQEKIRVSIEEEFGKARIWEKGLKFKINWKLVVSSSFIIDIKVGFLFSLIPSFITYIL